MSQACQDLSRLASIEPMLSDAALFAQSYIECQSLMLKSLSGRFWANIMQSTQAEIVSSNISALFKLCLQLEIKFTNLKAVQLKQIKILRLQIRALHLVFLMKATNKSALNATELFLKELEGLGSEAQQSPFLQELNKSLTNASSADEGGGGGGGGGGARKPGVLGRILQPLLAKYPIDVLAFDEGIKMSSALVYEPAGNNETPLKYTAGMILAVPVDCELFNVDDLSSIRIAIQTPDQKIMLMTPKSTDFIVKSDGTKRLLTNALMSHQIWSEALHVEIRIVLDVKANNLMAKEQRSNFDNLIALCEPIKVYVLPKAAKRGI
jgi:integrator complex subunit 4